jgi:hypothetical protein
MISILTQNNGAIINADNITTIGIVATENGKFDIVADQNYVLGIYENAQDAVNVLTWIASELGEHTDSRNLCFTMPTNDFLHPTNDTEEKKDAKID